jgi:Zn finger protein HypA/HybF involved in hydrogenase expression
VHEHSLIADLMRKITAIAGEAGAEKVISVKVQLGALCHLSAAHFSEHFTHAARDTVAEGARLDIETLTDETDLHAQDLRLDSVEVETNL